MILIDQQRMIRIEKGTRRGGRGKRATWLCRFISSLLASETAGCLAVLWPILESSRKTMLRQPAETSKPCLINRRQVRDDTQGIEQINASQNENPAAK